MAQFDRVARLTIGQLGGDGIVIEQLRISFDIEKDSTQETNKSSITVYNMAPATRKKVERPDSIAILEVGYKEDKGLIRIFKGNIVHVTHRREGADIVTHFEIYDGQVAIRDTVVSMGYAAGVNGLQITKDIASQMGLLLRIAPDVEFSVYPNGFSFVGYGRDAMRKVCDASGAYWSIQNNEIQVVMGGGTTGVQALVFSPASGLIGSPERIVRTARKASTAVKKPKKKKTEKKKKQAGWKVKTLLAPTASPADLLRVESMAVTGWLKVESLNHSGDTHGKDWVTNFELVEVMLDTTSGTYVDATLPDTGDEDDDNE